MRGILGELSGETKLARRRPHLHRVHAAAEQIVAKRNVMPVVNPVEVPTVLFVIGRFDERNVASTADLRPAGNSKRADRLPLIAVAIDTRDADLVHEIRSLVEVDAGVDDARVPGAKLREE